MTSKKPRGYWQNFDNVVAEARKIMKETKSKFPLFNFGDFLEKMGEPRFQDDVGNEFSLNSVVRDVNLKGNNVIVDVDHRDIVYEIPKELSYMEAVPRNVQTAFYTSLDYAVKGIDPEGFRLEADSECKIISYPERGLQFELEFHNEVPDKYRGKLDIKTTEKKPTKERLVSAEDFAWVYATHLIKALER
jgi:hypothetical protein